MVRTDRKDLYQHLVEKKYKEKIIETKRDLQSVRYTEPLLY